MAIGEPAELTVSAGQGNPVVLWQDRVNLYRATEVSRKTTKYRRNH